MNVIVKVGKFTFKGKLSAGVIDGVVGHGHLIFRVAALIDMG